MEWLANVNYRRAPPLISDCKNLFWTRVKCANNELKKARILDGALAVIGHFGVKKTSMDELAKAAGLSKQGLYHFESKEELLAAAADRYFTEGLRLVKEALSRPEVALQERLVEAMYAWCGRHLAHFHPSTLEVMEPRDNPISSKVQEVKLEFCRLLAEAVAEASEYRHNPHPCTPKELASVLFQFGLTWKEGHESRRAFRETVALCVRACFPYRRAAARTKGKAR